MPCGRISDICGEPGKLHAAAKDQLARESRPRRLYLCAECFVSLALFQNLPSITMLFAKIVNLSIRRSPSLPSQSSRLFWRFNSPSFMELNRLPSLATASRDEALPGGSHSRTSTRAATRAKAIAIISIFKRLAPYQSVECFRQPTSRARSLPAVLRSYLKRGPGNRQ